MAKLYFNYSTMNAGKSTALLQASYNYRERGMNTFLLTAAHDTRSSKGKITSRIGISQAATNYHNFDDLFEIISKYLQSEKIACIFVDEAQFLTPEQVWQLARVVDDLKIPVMCYGLRVDFLSKSFPGSARLLALADEIREVKTICWCGKKASMVVRKDANGTVQTQGEQVHIGGNDIYVSLCRSHWRQAINTDTQNTVLTEEPTQT